MPYIDSEWVAVVNEQKYQICCYNQRAVNSVSGSVDLEIDRINLFIGNVYFDIGHSCVFTVAVAALRIHYDSQATTVKNLISFCISRV